MRLLLINYEYPPVGAGAANATFHLARSLGAAGHKVAVLTSQFRGQRGWTVEEGISVYRCVAHRSQPDRSGIAEMLTFIAGAAGSLRCVVDKTRPEGCIVFFSIPCGPIGLLTKLCWRVPYVTSLRGGDVPGSEPRLAVLYRLLAPLRRLILRHSHAVVANSQGLKEMSERADPISVLVIPNGVDTDYFRPAPVRDNDGSFRVLFVGRFQRQKNLRPLLEQVAVLAKRLPDMEVLLELVGDGPLRGEIAGEIAALGLGGVVTLQGWRRRPEVLAAYHRADCVVNPSLYEGLPNAVLEAMACGLPVIASRVAGNETAVRDRESGFLFDLDHPGALGEYLYLLAQNRALCQSLGSCGRAIAMSDYSWNSVATKYVSLFTDDAGERSAPHTK